MTTTDDNARICPKRAHSNPSRVTSTASIHVIRSRLNGATKRPADSAGSAICGD
jgi:hypothetical protein